MFIGCYQRRCGAVNRTEEQFALITRRVCDPCHLLAGPSGGGSGPGPMNNEMVCNNWNTMRNAYP